MNACLNIFIAGLLLALLCAGPAMSEDASPATVLGQGKLTAMDKEGKRHKKAAESERITNSGPSTSVQMRMSGSLCIGCLVELERKLKLMPGISRVKVDIPGTGGFYDSYSGPGASGIITASLSYDPTKTSMEQVEDFIRTQGYALRKVIER